MKPTPEDKCRHDWVEPAPDMVVCKKCGAKRQLVVFDWSEVHERFMNRFSEGEAMKINKCSYCEGTPKSEIKMGGLRFISCDNCGLQGPLYKQEAEAIEAWNEVCPAGEWDDYTPPGPPTPEELADPLFTRSSVGWKWLIPTRIDVFTNGAGVVRFKPEEE